MSMVDNLYASDPGLRATLAFAVAVAALVVLALLLGVSPALVIPGMVIASVAASAQGADMTPKQRFQTLLMMALSGTGGLILGALSTGNSLLLGALFLTLILVVLASTPLGIGGTLVALAALASFYGATMLSPRPEQLPWAIGSAALGALIAAVLLGKVFSDSDVATPDG